MARLYVFADESGNFDFTNRERASRYVIICTCTMESCGVGADLLRLRRTLAWEGCELVDYFHASKDKQKVRNRVFDVIVNCGISVQATIMEKCKAKPAIRESWLRFYIHGWQHHFFNGMQKYCHVLSRTSRDGRVYWYQEGTDNFQEGGWLNYGPDDRGKGLGG